MLSAGSVYVLGSHHAQGKRNLQFRSHRDKSFVTLLEVRGSAGQATFQVMPSIFQTDFDGLPSGTAGLRQFVQSFANRRLLGAQRFELLVVLNLDLRLSLFGLGFELQDFRIPLFEFRLAVRQIG